MSRSLMGRYATNKHLGTVQLRDEGDRIRFVLDTQARNGCYYPELHVYRSGRNGSPAGFGPKGWPSWMVKFLGPSNLHDKNAWTNMLAITLPHLKWATAYKYRRFGGIQIHNMIYRCYRKVVTR